MVKVIIILIIIMLALVSVMACHKIKAELRTNLALNSKVAEITDVIASGKGALLDMIGEIKEKIQLARKSKSRLSGSASEASMQEEDAKKEAVKIFLKHGGVVEGKLLDKAKDSYTVEWKGEKFIIDSKQMDRVEYGAKKEIEWPYRYDVAVRRTNGIVPNYEITSVTNEVVTLSDDDGTGRAEMDIPRYDIDYLLFRPVYNKETEEIEARLKEQFPKMKIYTEGDVTIFTDSHDAWVNLYKKTIRDSHTAIYLKFFKLLKDRRTKCRNFIVVFDDFADYAEFAITDGVPFWAAVGYFKPSDKALYIFNAFGERIEKMVFDVIVGKTGKTIDEIVNAIKKRVDERYHEFIDGKVKELTDRFWDTYSMYKSELTDMTLSTLRHEFAHEVFHNMGLQNIIISKSNIDKKKLVDKKKEFLETKDYKKKEELLMGLMKLTKQEVETIDMDASESWLAEGIATYCGTEPIGGIDESWLFTFQEMDRKNELNPIEFLTLFKMGSFPGLCPKAMLNAYAESWAFTTFLMNRYPDQFMDFQRVMADKAPKDNEEQLKWLLDSLNKDLPMLEKEFRDYMKSYPKRDDPFVKRFMNYHRIWDNMMQ